MKCEVKRVMNAIKESAIATSLQPNQIIATHTASMSSASKGVMPLKQNIARCTGNVRSTEEGSLQASHRREYINLPESFKMFNNEPFLLYDSGPVTANHDFFSTKQNLNFLESCEIWMVDGTFKSSSTLFDQIFVIHGYRNKTSFPLVFCLTPKSNYINIQDNFATA